MAIWMDSVVVFVRQPFGYDSDGVSHETGLECLDVSMTVQDGKEDADINTLVKRFGLSGELPVAVRVPLSSDFVGLTDFHSAMNALRSAEESFMEMPAEVRGRFNHDPGAFVEFCSDVKNLPEMRKMGLAVEDVMPLTPEPISVRVVPEAPAAPISPVVS